ncbi:MAG: prenyltransferase [Planctomycetota bacterium]
MKDVAGNEGRFGQKARRLLLAGALLGLGLAWPAGRLIAQEDDFERDDPPSAPDRSRDPDVGPGPAEADGQRTVHRNAVEVSPATRLAIQRGLEFLSKRQEKSGAYMDGIGRKVNNNYMADLGEHVGVTGLVGMAFLSNGSTPGRGPYGKQVEGCVDFLLTKVTPNGMVKNGDSRMYSHAFATLFLAEVYGMAPSPKVQKGLQRAVNLIVSAQNEQGGWRYSPGAKDSDISITVCQVQALRAARNVGVRVPVRTISSAIEYVRKSYIPPGTAHHRQTGGFWYQVYENFRYRPSRTSFALTAAGVTALYGAGIYDGDEIRGGLRYLFDVRNRPASHEMRGSFDYFYGHYYAVQAFFQAGDGGERPYWSMWYPWIRDQLVMGQRPDGSWKDLVGPNYATAMSCVILQIPFRYLPIFER